MIKVLFCCHGSTAGSRELAALVGQNGANCDNRRGGVLRLRVFKTEKKWKTRLEVQLLHFWVFYYSEINKILFLFG